jgi:hypothetical protein
VDDLLADAWLIDLREDVRQHERLDSRALGDDGVVAVVAAGRAVGGAGFRSAFGGRRSASYRVVR